MSESKNVDTGTADGKQAGKDKDKARDLMDRDVPDQATSQTDSSADDRDEVYRPDQNVDNEKSPKGRSEPEHHPFTKEASLRGRQAREKTHQKRNINDTSEDAESSRRDG